MKPVPGASRIKVGVVGYGAAFNMGRAHLTEAGQAGMIPVAVSDTDPERLKAAEKDFPGIQTFSGLDRMLRKSDADLIVIITPHNTHAKLALQCLNAGRHVVCEKPFALTTQECDAMIAAAKKNGLMVSTYHNRHWDGCIMQAVKMVRSGAVGDLVRVQAHMGGWGKPGNWWRSSKSISGGILYDWGVHLLEYSLQLVDSAIVEVGGFAKSGFWSSHTSWKRDTIEDEGFAVIRFANGVWASLCMSSIDSRPREGFLEITGTRGTLVIDHGSWALHKHDGVISTITRGRNPPSEGWRFYRNVAGYLTRKEKLVITPEWARRPIHIIDLAYGSAKKGTSMKAIYK
jgi:predicted dehydrogenase